MFIFQTYDSVQFTRDQRPESISPSTTFNQISPDNDHMNRNLLLLQDINNYQGTREQISRKSSLSDLLGMPKVGLYFSKSNLLLLSVILIIRSKHWQFWTRFSFEIGFRMPIDPGVPCSDTAIS